MSVLRVAVAVESRLAYTVVTALAFIVQDAVGAMVAFVDGARRLILERVKISVWTIWIAKVRTG